MAHLGVFVSPKLNNIPKPFPNGKCTVFCGLTSTVDADLILMVEPRDTLFEKSQKIKSFDALLILT